jgi:hypothetical protein
MAIDEARLNAFVGKMLGDMGHCENLEFCIGSNFCSGSNVVTSSRSRA